jgi:adenylate kinase
MLPVVLIGSPGSGKGTQGKPLSGHFAIPHISTGDILRDHVQRRTLIGIAVKETLGKGLLVPDGLMEDLLVSRLKQADCDNGYILDGFPRTIWQAEWYYAHYGNPIAVLIDVPEKEALRRIAARNEHRADDASAEIAAGRMEEYHRLTEPIIGYYEREAKLYRVDGTMGADKVFRQIADLLESKEAFAHG